MTSKTKSKLENQNENTGSELKTGSRSNYTHYQSGKLASFGLDDKNNRIRTLNSSREHSDIKDAYDRDSDLEDELNYQNQLYANIRSDDKQKPL